ncbi:MAG TPA: hypothetical protein VGB26_01645 [Nitrospiria bacterium]|jgi:hypothetical protein
MSNKETDLLDHMAIIFIKKKTQLDLETAKRIFLAGKPWFTFGENEKGQPLKHLAREMAECIFQDNEILKKKVREISEKTGEDIQKIQKVLWAIVDYQVCIIEELLD